VEFIFSEARVARLPPLAFWLREAAALAVDAAEAAGWAEAICHRVE